MEKKTIFSDINNDDQTLWEGLKLGNEKSFSLLFKKHYDSLVKYGISFVSDKEKVQDCVQDVFSDVWIYRDTLNQSVVVKAYLFACVRNRIARFYKTDHVFRKSSSVESLNFLFEFSVEHHLIVDEISALKVQSLNKLLNALPPRQKEALYLRYHQSLTIDQISIILKMNYQSTSNLLHRSLVNLRKEWKLGSLLFLYCSIFF